MLGYLSYYHGSTVTRDRSRPGGAISQVARLLARGSISKNRTKLGVELSPSSACCEKLFEQDDRGTHIAGHKVASNYATMWRRDAHMSDRAEAC